LALAQEYRGSDYKQVLRWLDCVRLVVNARYLFYTACSGLSWLESPANGPGPAKLRPAARGMRERNAGAFPASAVHLEKRCRTRCGSCGLDRSVSYKCIQAFKVVYGFNRYYGWMKKLFLIAAGLLMPWMAFAQTYNSRIYPNSPDLSNPLGQPRIVTRCFERMGQLQ